MQVRELPLGRIVAAGAGVTAVVAVTVGAIVWPVLQRVDDTLSLIEDSLPILQAIQPEVDTIEDNVSELVPPITAVGPSLEGLDGRIDELSDPLVRVERRIAQLQASLGAVETLPALRRDLNQGLESLGAQLAVTNGSLSAVRTDFATTTRSIQQLTAAVAQLVSQFEQVVALLEETEEHVENLDRKTGPAPPGSDDDDPR